MVISDHPLFRQALAAALRDDGFSVTDQVCSTPLRNKHPDATIVDLSHTRLDTATLVEGVHAQLPEGDLVLLGTPNQLAASLDGEPFTEIEIARTDLASLRSVISGTKPRPSSELVRARRLWAAVTERQREVMRWLASGLDNQSIAAKLRVGTRAIKAHISALLALFGLDSRTQLALIAFEGGLRA
jgi:DNA-binding NarL/FixJ family response regulator